MKPAEKLVKGSLLIFLLCQTGKLHVMNLQQGAHKRGSLDLKVYLSSFLTL